MAKKFVKMMAAMLALCMCVSMMAVPAFAVEEVESTQKTDGTTVIKTTTTTEDTDENGNNTITVTVTEKTDPEDNEDNSGATVKYEQTTKTETTTDADGNLIKEQESGSGSEIKDWTVEDDGSAPGQTKVTVTVEVPESAEETASKTGSATTTTTTGNIQHGSGDKNYNYTETTTTEREVTVNVNGTQIQVNDVKTGNVGEQESGLKGYDPVYDEDDDVVYYTKETAGKNTSWIGVRIDDKHGKDGVFDRNYLSTNTSTDTSKWVVPEEGEYRYVGTGEHSKFYSARVYVVYKKDAEGNTLYDEEGNPIIEGLYRKADKAIHATIDGEETIQLPNGVTLKPIYDDETYGGSRAQTFMLMDKNGNRVYGYCCDTGTDTKTGSWYKVTNLEDSDYYASEESSDHIRSIVMNGYWGTSDKPKADGTYEDGSLENIKQKLKAAIESGELENTTVEMVVDGETVSKTMLELIDELTAGEAMLATQTAIWSYSNGHQGALNGKDGYVIVDPDNYYLNQDPSQGSKAGEALDDFGSARVDFLYSWLINLDTEEESTVVINEKNYIKEIGLTVGDKVADAAENQDDNAENDIYNAGLSFTLKFEPSQENDDLLLQITYTVGGETFTETRRLAGASKEGEEFGLITPDENGIYTIEGLQLGENEDINFDLRLEGTQYLEKGVYVYTAVEGRKTSQSFVGVAEGHRNVDVSASMNISFSVDEEDKYHAEAYWSWENDPVYPPEEPTETPENPTPTPKEPTPEDPTPSEEITEIPDETPLDTPEEELEEIPEDTPLAEVPKTGDESGMWTVMMILAAMSLLGLAVTGRKSLKA